MNAAPHKSTFASNLWSKVAETWDEPECDEYFKAFCALYLSMTDVQRTTFKRKVHAKGAQLLLLI